MEGSHSVSSRFREYVRRLTEPSAIAINVLVVDDEEPVRNFVARVLQDAGYHTTVASDGPDAIEKASKLETLDLVVSDVRMPHMPGDEMARRLRWSRPQLKILYLTGFSDSLFKERAGSFGVAPLLEDEGYLDKPCDIQSLREAVSLLVFGSFETPKALHASS